MAARAGNATTKDNNMTVKTAQPTTRRWFIAYPLRSFSCLPCPEKPVPLGYHIYRHDSSSAEGSMAGPGIFGLDPCAEEWREVTSRRSPPSPPRAPTPVGSGPPLPPPTGTTKTTGTAKTSSAQATAQDRAPVRHHYRCGAGTGPISACRYVSFFGDRGGIG